MGSKQRVLTRGRVTRRELVSSGLGGLLAGGIVRMLAIGGCGHRAPSEPSLPPVRAGEDRIGVTAPPLEVAAWIGDDPGGIAALRGRVVLVRFWTDTCPYCRASAPALVELDRDFAARGLVVLALHHPKPRGSTTDRDEVARIAAAWGFRFPVGLDADWRTIDAWWLGGGERAATSASLLVDRRGIIRWVHPGPEYHPGGGAEHAACRRDYADLRRAIELLLDEPG